MHQICIGKNRDFTQLERIENGFCSKWAVLSRHGHMLFEVSVLLVRTRVNTWFRVWSKQQLETKVEMHFTKTQTQF